MKHFLAIFTLLAANLGFAASYKPSEEFSQLQKTSQAFTQIAKKGSPAVVLIKTQAKAPRNSLNSDFFEQPRSFDPLIEEFFRKFFGNHRLNSQSSPFQGAGSGFFASPDGYIITNNHVIKDADKIAVFLDNGKQLDAKVVGTDPRTDLAVLKVDIKDAAYIEFANSDNLDTGEWVVAIGHPFELRHTVTAGIVSATEKDRDHLKKITDIGGLIQTDAAINPGNSGGPLLNLDGDLVGVNVAIATTTGSFAGIGFAIPSKVAKHVYGKIVENGVVDRAYLGVILQPIDQELAEATNLDAAKGILVSEVMKDSPADTAGLLSGDIILELNGSFVKSVNSFRNNIALMTPKKTVHLKVKRKGKLLNIDVTLGILSELETGAKELFQKLGVEIEDFQNLSPEALSRLGYSANTPGVLITNVKPNSPAQAAGLSPYHVITGVVINWDNQRKVYNKEDLQKALKEVGNKKHVVLIVRQKNFQRYYTLKVE